MRIALVAPHVTIPGPRTAAGQGPGVTPLAQALGRLGHRVTIYAREDSPTLPRKVTLAPRVTVEHVPAGPARRMSGDELAAHAGVFGDYLARRWRREPPDVAHAHFLASGLATLAGTRSLPVAVPVIQTFHSVGTPAAPPAATARGMAGGRPAITPPHEQIARMRLKVSLARSVSAVLASSSEELSDLATLGVPRASIKVVPLGVDTGRFAPEGPSARRSRRPRLVSVAPLTERQGLDVVIRALTGVPEAELLVAAASAAGSLDGNAVYQRLVDLARDLRVADRVTFTGNVTARRLPALLRSADLLVSAAWDEPFGTVALEAMACGTPVVASAVGVNQDAVVEGTTGMLVPPGHPDVLSARIRALLASPLRLEAFGIAAADRARSRYSWERIGRETVRVYEGSVTGTGSGGER